jgi:uncharacterized hydrophobic protein (TIGR00271 family)
MSEERTAEVEPSQSDYRWRNFGVRSLGVGLKRLTPEERDQILSDLFLSADAEFAPYVWRFSVLLGLSAIIASFGLLSGSAAVVIGAMLVAPLMEPILATSAALVMGWYGRLLRSLILVIIGATMVVAVSFLFSMPTPDVPFMSREVMARTEPTLFDLGVAAAAGAVGVFTMIYRVNAAAPGVAIAVSLVPPLASAGIAAEQGLYEEAFGALLLFLTNFSMIILVASMVLAGHGFSQLTSAPPSRTELWRGVGVTTAFVIVIAVPLAEQTGEIFQEVRMEAVAYEALKGVSQNFRVEAEGDTLRVMHAGGEVALGVDELANTVSERVGKPITVQYQWFAVEETIARGTPE